jgi:hypothetical protein
VGGADEVEADFEAALSRLHLRRPKAAAERRMLVLGVLTAVVGLVLLVVALAGTRQAGVVEQQLDNLALAPLGLGLTGVGCVVWLRYSLTRYLRFWLVRFIHEERAARERS